MSTEEFNFFVAGVKFHELHKVLDLINSGDDLFPMPEPDNPYDPNAVQLRYLHPETAEDVMVGYVPGSISAPVTALIEIADKVSCKVLEVNESADTWKQLRVEIKELKDA